jgi:hypothetical protein
MWASFILCQACGCKGRAGHTISRNQSESPVFLYNGHDPFEGVMRYSCANCHAMLLIDPMEMLSGPCVKGVPELVKTKSQKKNKPKPLFLKSRVLQKIPKKIQSLRYH